MSRVSPTPVEVWFDGRWHRGTLRSCEITPDGATCSAVVSWTYEYPRTARFMAKEMRDPAGELGCPAAHQDGTCGTPT